jgi:RNA polymerase-binding transcription factor DksA
MTKDARITELEDERDAWKDTASEHWKTVVEFRAQRDEAKSRITELEAALRYCEECGVPECAQRARTALGEGS